LREGIKIFVTALPGLVAVAALIFTAQSLKATIDATNRQLQIAEQGQVTDRYNNAINNLGSPSVDVRLGGILTSKQADYRAGAHGRRNSPRAHQASHGRGDEGSPASNWQPYQEIALRGSATS
jgi:hypothetical protein